MALSESADLEFGTCLFVAGRDAPFRLSAVATDGHRVFGIVPAYVFAKALPKAQIYLSNKQTVVGRYRGHSELDVPTPSADGTSRLSPIQSLFAAFEIDPDYLATHLPDIGIFWPEEAIAPSWSLGLNVVDITDPCVAQGQADNADAVGTISAFEGLIKLDIPGRSPDGVYRGTVEVDLFNGISEPVLAGTPLLTKGGALVGPIILSEGQQHVVAPILPYLRALSLSLWQKPSENSTSEEQEAAEDVRTLTFAPESERRHEEQGMLAYG